MTYREKSAWLMLLVTLMVGVYMASEVLLTVLEQRHLPPVLPVFITLTVTLIGLSIIAQIGLSVFHPDEARQKSDERVKGIANRAQAIAGVVLSIGVAGALVRFLFLSDGTVLFYTCLLSLVVAQSVEYAGQIIGFRNAGV
ncbi:hypothetical protein [Alteromonas halophila]|uniref:DUF2178 domain-containing protein n=1 Tax=Alteromonas halophila TaxID=516698 RepID=A0A918MUI9_9ALTE|nr:hypothetical protein [Alteromonas halophila]GGW76239.1 hypothetical protein GCM10007391_05980 [Alteromonas halophila]